MSKRIKAKSSRYIFSYSLFWTDEQKRKLWILLYGILKWKFHYILLFCCLFASFVVIWAYVYSVSLQIKQFRQFSNAFHLNLTTIFALSAALSILFYESTIFTRKFWKIFLCFWYCSALQREWILTMNDVDKKWRRKWWGEKGEK